MRSPSFRLLTFLSLCFAFGCKAEVASVDLLVALRTDYVAGSEFSDIRVSVAGTSAQVITEACNGQTCTSFDLPRLVGTFEDLPQSAGRRVEVTLLDAEGNAVASDSGVIDHDSRTALVLWITRSCAEVTCEGGQRCLGASCVDARCTDGTQRECGDLAQACERDQDCEEPACGRAVCTEGVCELEITPESCPSDSMCVPRLGCADPDDMPGQTGDGDGDVSAPDGGSEPEPEQDAAAGDPQNRFPKLEPVVTSYLAADGFTYSLFAWIGNETALLTTVDTLDPEVMGRILTVYDDIYLHYERINARSPLPSQSLAGRATIAFLPTLPAECTLGSCFSFGRSGLELFEDDLVNLYVGVRDEDRFDVSLLELLALSFWFYEAQIGHPNTDVMAFGFAICSGLDALLSERPGIMERAGQDLRAYRTVLEAFVDTYVALGAPFDTTILQGTAPTNNNNLGGGALVCSMMRRIRTKHPGFDTALWREVAKLPASLGTVQSASDGFLVAASRAAKADLSSVIADRWGFPVSTSARAQAGAAGPAVSAEDY